MSLLSWNGLVRVALAVGCLAVSPSVAVAQQCAGGRRAVDLEATARDLRIQPTSRPEDIRRALDLLQEAWILCQRVSTRARMASIEAELGFWVDAETHILEALSRQDDSWWGIHGNRERVQADLQAIRHHLGDLEVTSSTPGARLAVGGQARPEWPQQVTVRVVAGWVNFEVSAPGYNPFQQRVEVLAGTRYRERVALDAIRSGTRIDTGLGPTEHGPGPAGGTGTTTGSGTVTTVTQSGPAANPTPTGPGAGWRVAGWTGLALGAIGLGVGFAGLVHADARRDSYDADPQCSPREINPALCAEYINGVEAGRLTEIVGFVAGGALVATGAVLLVAAPSSRPGMALSCGPLLQRAGVTCRFNF